MSGSIGGVGVRTGVDGAEAVTTTSTGGSGAAEAAIETTAAATPRARAASVNMSMLGLAGDLNARLDAAGGAAAPVKAGSVEELSASIQAMPREKTANAERIFGEIRDHVGRVVEVMAEIAAASQQQASGVSEINGMVDEVARATQQNAATTEESASAAEELSGQAESLKELVAGFALNGSSQAVRPKPRPAPAPAPLMRPAPLRKPGRVVHLRSVPPPAARAATGKASQLIPFDDEEGARAMTEF